MTNEIEREKQQVITKDMVKASTTRPNAQTVVIPIGLRDLKPAQHAAAQAMLKLGEPITHLVPRGTGVVVASLLENEFWRCHYGDKISTKRCLECGEELNDRVERVSRGGDLTSTSSPIFMHFCDKHPSHPI